MVYHFFSKWKHTETEVFSIKGEIEEAEKLYMLKIRLFKAVWDRLSAEKIELPAVRELLVVYKNPRNSILYKEIINKLKTISSIGVFSRQEVDQFYDLVLGLHKKMERETRLAVKLLERLELKKIPDGFEAVVYKIQDLLKMESQFLRIDDKAFRKIENTFLIKKEPGASSRGYVHIFKAVQSGLVKFEKNKLWIGTKPIQGLRVHHNKIFLKGDHYTAMQNAKWIAGDGQVTPSTVDPFSYFVERGKLSGWRPNDIKRFIGAKSAEAVVSLEIEIFPEQLYIKVEEKLPIKFAIAQLYPQQIRRVIREATLVG